MSKREVLWVLQAQCGDRSAMDKLLRSLGPVMVRYLRRYTGQQATAQDVAQEALLVVARKLSTLRNAELIRPWALRIASRHAVRELREEAKTQPLSSAEQQTLVDPSAEQNLRAPLESLSVARLAATLPSATRAVVWLHYVEELSIREVAEVLDLSVGTAKSRLSYGLTRLRNEIKQPPPASP